MARLLVRTLFLTVWFVCLDSKVQQDRPRITTSNGDLVLVPAFNKNIYLRTNGPKSGVFVGDVKLSNRSSSEGVPYTQPSDVQKVNIDNILQRLEALENRNWVQSSSLQLNISLLWRRVNRQANLIANLRSRINDRSRNDCQSGPCSNGGTCLNIVDGYYCLCPSNWEGRNCDIDVNECRNFAGTDLGCQNGAICLNRPGSYECLCRSGWFGVHCTRKAKDCSGGDREMCGHGACIPVTTGEGIKCICDQGWTTNGTGVSCLTDVNECESSQGPRCSVNPRVECINLPGSFRCGQCPPGFEGDGYICSDIDECITIPNGGCSTSPMVACHNTIGSRICGSCPPGYQGDGVTCTWRGSCSVNRGGCHPSAQCIDNGQVAQCVCPVGMDGDGIGIHGCYVRIGDNGTRGCETNPCGIHGQCHLLRAGYTCICYRGFSGAHCDVAADYCASSPCRNGGSCRPDESSLRGYRCECTAQYTGDLCHIASKNCGGLLLAEEGSIVYPLTNTTYNHNSRCAWVIRTNPDKVINVTFSKFNLEANPDCAYDFLQIHDGRSSASQIIGRFCGNEFPNGGNILSSHNNLYFWFRSDQTVAKDGFALHWTSVDPVCGGEVNATSHGHISSPGSPGKYPPNRDCYWHLTTTLGKRIQLHFFALDIESHPNCSFDYISIYDGSRTSDPLLSRYCNSTQPAPVQSATSELLIHFHSDAYGQGNGFQIAFAPMEGVPGCGGLFTDDKGEIVSPSYNGKYLSNLLCEYEIRTTPDTKILIRFNSFALEESPGCKFDYLKIYDGASSNSKYVGKFCGNRHPKSYTSSTNTLFMKFKTDYSQTANGFKITYETVCRQTVVGDSGVIKSPQYPFSYPANKVCEYFIITRPGKAIQLTFQDFDIEDNRYYNCQYDNVEIRDGPDSNATLLGRYCGGVTHTPPVQISTHNHMYVRFNSDLSVSGTGFYANFTTIDTECGGIYRDTVGLISHPSETDDYYKNEQSCTWMLIAPEGMVIKITWNRFDLEKMPRCSSDYLEIIEVDSDNENSVIGKYCGNVAPPAITASTNRLILKFETDSTVRAAGFSLSYTFLDERLHCGATYTKSHGFIYSPGWPNRYENGRQCTWTIIAPAGQQIALNIIEFDVEQPIQNKCHYGDYLEIRNGKSESSPLIGKYCGNFQSKRIVSLGNALYLRFYSDSYLTGKGFKIEWDNTITGCGGVLTSSNGSISSPNYPDPYNDDAECFYRIVISAGSRIRIHFKDLDLERTPNCRDDYVQIYDGRNENSRSLGKYCSTFSELNNIDTSTNYAFIKFRSDFYLSAKGFFLEYSTICHNNLTGIYGVIESPGYPDSKIENLNCLWTINVPKGNKINVTFSHFAIRKQRLYSHRRLWHPLSTDFRVISECSLDYLQIKESSETLFGNKMCGYSIPPRYSSRSNSLQIKFVINRLMTSSGFRLEWVRYGCGGHIVQKPYGSINLDKGITSGGEMECEWLIEVQEGKNIRLTIYEIYMTDSVNCTIDAIEVYNGPSLREPLLTKICHRGVSSVVSTGNMMFVRFVKRSSLKDVYFYSAYDTHPGGCDTTIEALSGVVVSKNYPKNYENNMYCTWLIEVPRNHRVELNFIDLDLYSFNSDETQCRDYIQVYDGRIGSVNYTQRICPNSHVSQIITTRNVLQLEFVSDDYGTAKGFKANFTMICGSTITARYDGIIVHDKSAGRSHNNCTWTIIAPSPDQKISLTITYMSIPKNNDIVTNRHCPSSFLRIYNGNDDSAPLVDEFCGRKVPPMIVSQGSAITIQLGTYNGSAALGQFSAYYSPLTSACGGHLTSEQGMIASPNYPQSYPVSASCEWTLSTSPGNRVYITFEQFDVDYSENCNSDYLEVREENGAGRLLGVYCGAEIPTNVTTATQLYIKFHSDNINTGRGFLMHYEFLHGNVITGTESGQICSPLYPAAYEGEGEYTWRIFAKDSGTVTINVERVEIPVHGEICYNYLAIYDGYDADAPLLDIFCGIIDSHKILQTSSDVVFIKLKLDDTNFGSTFVIAYTRTDRSIHDLNDKINCGSNDTETVVPGQIITFSSPNYPNYYSEDLHCEWIYKATDRYHLNLVFQDITLEETPQCFADSISIYSSENAVEWIPVKENICLSSYVNQETNSSKYMKIKFKTDMSINRKGFQAKISSQCGGLINLPSGEISANWTDVREFSTDKTRCVWTIKVRPGRHIKLRFEHFNITNIDGTCDTFVILRNGESAEAPLLGNGKFCGSEHENRSDIESSSNSIYVSYSTNYKGSYNTFQTFALHYEEKGIECGVVSKLDDDHKWEIINSPNYPSIPPEYTECVFIFTGPPGEILRIDFLDRFDLRDEGDCSTEFVEIRDGSSEFAPLKGRFCGRDNPGTVKTSSNVVHIKYLTQTPTPNDGFKANVSIDVCGGTIVASKGVLKSPNYPHMQMLPYGTVCEWRIIGSPREILNIYALDVHLPEPESACATKVTIEENMPINNTITILHTICGGADDTFTGPIEASSNEVTVKLYIGKPSEWVQTSQFRGFKLTFNSSRQICGGRITASEGYLATPGYPRETNVRYCQWFITAPDPSRRIRIEFLDSDVEKHKIGMFNDLHFQNIIQILPTTSATQSSGVFESSGNQLALYLWLESRALKHRFKAKFTSEEAALCGGSLSGSSGELISPILNRSYTCEWHYNNNQETDFKTIFVSATVNSSSDRSVCRFSDSKLIVKSTVAVPDDVLPLTLPISRSVCGNTEFSYRIPSTVIDVKVIKNNFQSFFFNMKWKLQPCGGVIHLGANPVNILNISSNYSTTDLDCAWFVTIPADNRAELKLEGSFLLDCSDEFIQVSHGYDQYSPFIGEYCKNRGQEQPLLTPFRYMIVQYHSKAKTNISVKLLAKVISNQCGGYSTKYDNIFSSPNFPKSYDSNIECTWLIKADLGSRISLQFIERFAVEDQANCSKDAVIVYDRKEDGSYAEIARLCGRLIPKPLNSTSNEMKVVLRTDADVNLDGFKAMWDPICGGKFEASIEEKILYSPGYPARYSPSLDCSYELFGSDNKKIILKFIDFELEGTYPSCEYDNVTLIASQNYNYFSEVYCGNEKPPELNSYKKVTMNFKTDRFIDRKGFKISYQVFSCGGPVKQPAVLSSSVGDHYDNDLNCTWFIEAPINKKVILRFQYIDLESQSDCFADYIAVFNGLSIDEEKRVALMCGHVNSTTVLSGSGNSMLLQFVSDYGLSRRGFKVEVLFSYDESVGCGGQIQLTSAAYTLKSPLINGSFVYENFLDCHWTVKAPVDQVIKIEFVSFHVSSCRDVNQTALGISKCDCDLVEIKDGLNPTSTLIGTYCGHNLPPQLVSSGNYLSIRLVTDGEFSSSGFEARLSTQPSVCGHSVIVVSQQVQRITSPGYSTGSIARGLHCVYHFEVENDYYRTMRMTIKNLDLRPGDPHPSQCNKDKLTISSFYVGRNVSLGNQFVFSPQTSSLYSVGDFDENEIHPSNSYLLCGIKQSMDFYLMGNVLIDLQTSFESDSVNHKGFEIEVSMTGSCGRNYTESQGRIKIAYESRETSGDCYILITASENYTISMYFISVIPDYSSYVTVYDGNKTTDRTLLTIDSVFEDNIPLFTTGRYALLKHHYTEDGYVTLDMNYVTTNKGRGCGGKLNNLLGKVTSPMYPGIYRQKGTCEWELETPVGTRLLLRFPVFDMGVACDQNYVQLVDSAGAVVSNYCDDTPADYTASDNYVKIVFTTTMNNGGTGWIAEFVAVV